MCNIAYVKVTKNSKFLLKINNYLLKSYVFIQNIQVPMQSYYLKLLNICKFAHDRKTLNKIMITLLIVKIFLFWMFNQYTWRHCLTSPKY